MHFRVSMQFSSHSNQKSDVSPKFFLQNSVSRGHSGEQTIFSQKMPMFVCISKKPNWVPAEWCWRLRFESTLNYFVKILRNNNKISHCALKSQPSAPFSCTQFGFFEIQTNLGIFWKDSFFYHKCPLEALFWRKNLGDTSQYWL